MPDIFQSFRSIFKLKYGTRGSELKDPISRKLNCPHEKVGESFAAGKVQWFTGQEKLGLSDVFQMANGELLICFRKDNDVRC